MRQHAVGEARTFDMAEKADVIGDFRPRELPGIAEGEPVFGIFVLPAVLERLAKQAVVVTNAISHGGDFESRHAVHETGGEAPEPAIAERRIGLERAQHIEVDAKFGERVAHRLGQAEIGQRVDEQTANEKFEREIINATPVFLIIALRRREPRRNEPVAGRKRGRDEPVARTGVGVVLADRIGETPLHVVAQRGDDGLMGGLGRVKSVQGDPFATDGVPGRRLRGRCFK